MGSVVHGVLLIWGHKPARARGAGVGTGLGGHTSCPPSSPRPGLLASAAGRKPPTPTWLWSPGTRPHHPPPSREDLNQGWRGRAALRNRREQESIWRVPETRVGEGLAQNAAQSSAYDEDFPQNEGGCGQQERGRDGRWGSRKLGSVPHLSPESERQWRQQEGQGRRQAQDGEADAHAQLTVFPRLLKTATVGPGLEGKA